MLERIRIIDYLSAIGLTSLLLKINSYEFYKKLKDKIISIFKIRYAIDTCLIPTWNNVAKTYLLLYYLIFQCEENSNEVN
ncbi:hypothetical protein TUZN_0013 [Thermoproteus uzoniensis 768-20]|uniref:Uncharacterized protein n=2 Tax=Thermoproteus TaxID=2270 RepID=F2L0P0_THEU7|nr:hypothetical protein TUZN_0013 [Thermoproteus uzoniensis 768-20]